MKSLILVVVTLIAGTSFAQNSSDLLAQESIKYQSANPDAVLQATVDNIKSVFDRYQVKLDRGMSIISPLQVGGTQNNPTIKTTIKKCVAFICKTVTLDAVVSIAKSKGNCRANFTMTVDLDRSSQDLTDVYSQFDVKVCMNSNSQNARIDLIASAEHAESYSEGIIQNEIFKILQLQISPIVSALSQTLKANGAK